jgi:hypothetical protein
MADSEATTVHTAEVVRYDDPVIITERVAVAAFIAGYIDPTRRSYATDLRIFAGWCHDHGIDLLNVKRPHLETFARWMEQEGRMASKVHDESRTLGLDRNELGALLAAQPAALVHHRRPRRRGPVARRARSRITCRPSNDDALRPGPTQP